MAIDRKIKGTIHWVSIDHGVDVEVREYGRLFSDATPDKYEDDFINYLEKDSLIINKRAVFEPSVLSCEPGVPVQMVRKGYYVRDVDSEKVVFNKTVSLKEDKNK
jgi:glutaminyl-tRNA synthetase